MKAFLTLLTICVLIFAIGCNSEPVKKIGIIHRTNVSEEAFEKFYKQLNLSGTENVKTQHIFFNSMNEMMEALQSGQIDELTTYEIVGKYLAEQNHNFECLPQDERLADAFCCAVRESDIALKKEFDKALDEIIADGTLTKLSKQYIFDIFNNSPPAVVEMPKFYDDDEYTTPIKIGVTGDMPPLDYVSSDGKPAGFNTALLAEISKRMEKNFKIIPIDGGARAIALSSKLVDVIFWVIVPTYDDFPIDVDKPKGIILTDPYFTDEIVHVKLKK